MSIAYVSVCLLIASRRGDVVLDGLVGCGTAVVIVRLAIVVVFQRRGASLKSDRQARRWERRYACASYAFAILLGLTGLRIVGMRDPVAEMLFSGVLFGYATGVICRLGGPTLDLPAEPAARLHPRHLRVCQPRRNRPDAAGGPVRAVPARQHRHGRPSPPR